MSLSVCSTELEQLSSTTDLYMVILSHLFPFSPLFSSSKPSFKLLEACLSQAVNYVGLNVNKAKVRGLLVNGSPSKLYAQASLALGVSWDPLGKFSALHFLMFTPGELLFTGLSTYSRGILQFHPP